MRSLEVSYILPTPGLTQLNEISGYLYFHAAPNAEDFHAELIKRVKNLHTADCLRANKSTMAWGLEARVPFLDKKFLEVAMNFDAKYKMFTKGKEQEVDEDGKPKMEKVSSMRVTLTS
jgi:asparagine synthase (glutamine-hydrolysing)